MIAPGIDAFRWLRAAVATDMAKTHALTFRDPETAEGKVRCTECRREFTAEEWAASKRCAGGEGGS